MNSLQLSDRIIHDVLVKNASFAVVSKYILNFKGVDNLLRNESCAIAGAALRHYFALEKRIVEAYENITLETKISCLSYLADHLFSNKNSEEKQVSFLKSAFKETGLDYKKIIDISRDNLIDDTIDKSSDEYLSLRYNLPLWIIKMWRKHFGEKLFPLTLRGISNKMNVFVKQFHKDYKLENSENFEQSKFENLLKYCGKTPLILDPNFTNKEIFAIRPALDYMLNLVDIDTLRGIALYQGNNTNLYLDLAARFSYFVDIDILCSSSSCYHETKTNVENYHLSKARVYEEQANTMELCISKQVHTYFVMPNSSNFALLRTTPDYCLRVKQESLDSIIEKEKEALEQASKIVENNGQLIYAVTTLNKKESTFLVREFLKEHKEFYIKEERQFFPFDRFDSVFYFAILVKKENED